MDAFLETFEVTATAAEWPRAQWSLYLRSSLAGQGMAAVSMLGAEDQGRYEVVKQTLLSIYHISAETYRKIVFENNLMWQNQMSGFVHINKLLLSASNYQQANIRLGLARTSHTEVTTLASNPNEKPQPQHLRRIQ